MSLTPDEQWELQTLRTCPLPMTGAQLTRYITLAHQDGQDFHRELARSEQRHQAWALCGEVVFWLLAVPWWVVNALLGRGTMAAILIGGMCLVWYCPRYCWPLQRRN